MHVAPYCVVTIKYKAINANHYVRICIFGLITYLPTT